jgi:hypothetical protein
MPRDSRPKASQFHRGAAHAAQLAATQHGKQDYQTGHGKSRQALKHSANAFSESQKGSSEIRNPHRQSSSPEVTHAE